MSKSSRSTYCRIIDFLDDHDSEMAEIVRGTCADIPLSRDRFGVTFLVPTGEFRKKIAKLARSDNPRDAAQACALLNACILSVTAKTPEHFKAFGNQVPNSLYPKQTIGAVTFDKSGTGTISSTKATIKPEPKFKDSSLKDNLAVWILEGEIKTDGPLYQRDVKGKNKGVSGGYKPTSEQSENLRYKIAVKIENEFALAHASGRPEQCPIMRAAQTLLAHISRAENINTEILPRLSGCESDFYLLVEPHVSDATYLVSDSLIQTWWDAYQKNPRMPQKTVSELLKEAVADKSCDCKLYNDRDSLIKFIGEKRNSAWNSISGHNACDIVNSCYKELSDNKLGELENVYPRETADAFKGNNMKMYIDEFCYVTHYLFKKLKEGFNSSDYNFLINLVGDYMNSLKSGDDARKSILKVLRQTSNCIQASAKVAEIQQFVNSTCFLSIPYTSDEAKSLGGNAEPSVDDLWNIAQEQIVENGHRKFQGGSERLEVLLGGLDPTLAARIRDAL